MRRNIWASVAIVAALVSGIFWLAQRDPPELAHPGPTTPESQVPAPIAGSPATAIPVTANSSSPVPVTERVDWRGLFGAADEEIVQSLVEEPQVVKRELLRFTEAAAKGDMSAILSLYHYASLCAGAASQNAQIPDASICEGGDDALLKQSWTKLGETARKGNVEAAVFMFNEAVRMFRVPQNSPLRATMTDDALRALEETALNRRLIALRFLAAVYSDAMLGETSQVKAFAYLDIYAQATGDAAAIGRVHQLESLLRQTDMVEARKIQARLLERLK